MARFIDFILFVLMVLFTLPHAIGFSLLAYLFGYNRMCTAADRAEKFLMELGDEDN